MGNSPPAAASLKLLRSPPVWPSRPRARGQRRLSSAFGSCSELLRRRSIKLHHVSSRCAGAAISSWAGRRGRGLFFFQTDFGEVFSPHFHPLWSCVAALRDAESDQRHGLNRRTHIPPQRAETGPDAGEILPATRRYTPDLIDRARVERASGIVAQTLVIASLPLRPSPCVI